MRTAVRFRTVDSCLDCRAIRDASDVEVVLVRDFKHSSRNARALLKPKFCPLGRVSRPLIALTRRLLFALYVVGAVSAHAQAAENDATTDEGDPFAGVEEMVVMGSENAAALLVSSSDSATTFDSELLGSLRVTNISDLADYTPNLEIVTSGTTSPTLFIRGVGLNDFSANATGAISVFQDNVARNSSAIQLGRIFDTRGSQSSSAAPRVSVPYRNASGGAIKILPKRPSGEFGAWAFGVLRQPGLCRGGRGRLRCPF